MSSRFDDAYNHYKTKKRPDWLELLRHPNDRESLFPEGCFERQACERLIDEDDERILNQQQVYLKRGLIATWAGVIVAALAAIFATHQANLAKESVIEIRLLQQQRLEISTLQPSNHGVIPSNSSTQPSAPVESPKETKEENKAQ